MNQTLSLYYIITVSYNDYDNLSRTINSIRKYKTSYQKYVIIDGGSIDRSAELIKLNQDIIDYILIERDSGIYDAMNKISRFPIADNDYLLWLNAGDELLPWERNVLLSLQNFDCGFFSVIGKLKPIEKGIKFTPRIFYPQTEKSFFPLSFFMHQGFLIKTNTFLKLKYDLTVGLQAECLLMSYCINKNNYYISEMPLSVYYLDGISNKAFFKILKSYFKVAKKLGLKLTSLIYFQRKFILKLIIKGVLPTLIVKKLREYYVNRRSSCNI